MTTLVLLHAFPLDAAMYDGVASAFEGDLLTPNLPGFGGEALVEGEPSLDAYAEGVARYLDAKGIERAVIGGTSMGGYTAMAFYRLFPERVAALALIDTKASADAPEAAEGRRTMAQQMVDGQTTDPLVANVLPNLLGATTFATRPDVVTTVEGWVQGADPAAAAWAQLAMAARPDSLQTLAKVSVPSLVVVGSEDVLSPPTDAAAMATVLPAAELVLIPTVGHLTPVEAPEEVTVALNDLM
ncbi:MAG: alpha/beta hydrolase, partial [Actinomycetes bacterium]